MEVLTVGHSDHSIEDFIALLRKHSVEALVDTRSEPFSARHPQFTKHVVSQLLGEAGIRYYFLGDKVGGRPADRTLYDEEGAPDYDKMAQTSAYKEGIESLLELARGDENVAIMCSEGDYKQCHRYLLVSRSLALLDVEVNHILRDGTLEENPAPQLAMDV